MSDAPHTPSENGLPVESVNLGGGSIDEQARSAGRDSLPDRKRPRNPRPVRKGPQETTEGDLPSSNGGGAVQNALKRLGAKSAEALDITALHDGECRERWPVLFEALNARRDVNGDDCDPGSFTVSAKGGVLFWSFRSPAYNVRLTGWTETLSGLPDSLEEALRSENTHFVELKKHVSKKWRDKMKKS